MSNQNIAIIHRLKISYRKMENNLTKGIAIMLMCSLFSSISAAGTKYASSHMSLYVILFIQYGIGLLFAGSILMRRGIHGFGTQRWHLHLLRGVCGVAALFSYYLALTHVQLVEATLLRNATPLLVPIIIRIWLGIKIPGRRWVPLAIGFIGVIIILRPGFTDITLYHLVALCSAALIGITMVSSRLLMYTESITIVLFYYHVLAVGITFPFAIKTWQPAPWSAWGVLASTGILLYTAMNFYTMAFRYAKPSIVSPISFFGVVFAGLWGWVFWNQIPIIWTYLGMFLVIVGAVLILVQEKPDDQLPLDLVGLLPAQK
jgi:drug/metabolite transporter (DMT)-like permease